MQEQSFPDKVGINQIVSKGVHDLKNPKESSYLIRGELCPSSSFVYMNGLVKRAVSPPPSAPPVHSPFSILDRNKWEALAAVTGLREGGSADTKVSCPGLEH